MDYKKIRRSSILDIISSGKYYCNKHGTVYSRARKNEIEISFSRKRNGYLGFSMFDLKKTIYVSAHQFVWLYFNGNYESTLQINHKDGDKLNNRIDNLELVTGSENSKHAYRMGLIKSTLGEDSAVSKLKEKQVVEIKNKILNGSNCRQLSKQYGVCRQTISKIKNNKTWSHVEAKRADAGLG